MSGWVRRVVLRNFSLKVIALALAVLLHFLVRPTDHRPATRKARTTRVEKTVAHAPDAGAASLRQQGPGGRPRRHPSQANPPAMNPATTQPATTQPTAPSPAP